MQTLSGVLASPVNEDDYAEKGRRAELWRFVFPQAHIRWFITYHTRRKLQGVIMKLEPLSEQDTLIRFLRNADNTKTLTGFVQELADAITDYQVRATGPIVIFNEHPARFRCNKECMRGPGTSW